MIQLMPTVAPILRANKAKEINHCYDKSRAAVSVSTIGDSGGPRRKI
jgi:hypothetical protein